MFDNTVHQKYSLVEKRISSQEREKHIPTLLYMTDTMGTYLSLVKIAKEFP